MAADERKLIFRLEVSTDMDEGDEIAPTIEYVEDWLTQNGYDSKRVGQPEIETGF